MTKSPAAPAAAQDDFGNTPHPGIFRDLEGRIIPIHRGDAGPQLLRQPKVCPQLRAFLLRLSGKLRCFHKKRGKGPMKRLRHTGGGADDPALEGAPDRQIKMCSPA